MKQIPVSPNDRRRLGIAYLNEIDQVRSDRAGLVQTWRKSHDNYEAKAPVLDWPWPRNISSSAIIPIVPTHTDAIASRLYNTATGQDPIYYPELVGTYDLPAEVTPEEFTSALETLSRYIEGTDVPIHDVLMAAILIAVKYGDSIIYIPFVSKERYDYSYDADTDEWTKSDEPVELEGRPVPKVLHPENFYIPTYETGRDAIQRAKYVAYEFDVDYDQIVRWRDQEFYRAEDADALLKLLRPNEEEAGKPPYFTDKGDDSPLGDQDTIRLRNRASVGTTMQPETRKLRMYHVWAREDMDGDGFEEEIQFHVHQDTGIVPHITWNYYDHKKRPFVRISYAERDGHFNSIGVPEMLENIQAIVNEIMRDILNNNKVQNTKMFVARANSGIDPQVRLWPGRVLFLENPADFQPVDLGSGRQITSIQDLITLQQWGERRTGITDFNLGQERTSRTPATTTLALLEEANKRIDLVIRRLRISMQEMWYIIMSLYFQYGFSDQAMSHIFGPKADQIQAAIDDMTVADLTHGIRFSARVSTQNLNRSVRRNEALAEYGQMKEFYTTVLGLVQAIKTNQDPALLDLLMAMYNGYYRIINKFLNTFDEYAVDEINPDLRPMLKDVELGVANAIPTLEGQTGAGGPLEQALGLAQVAGGAGGPIAPPGRPSAGLERVPQGSPEERNLSAGV